MPDEKEGPVLGVAVFGAGRIGAVHANNVARQVPGARLVGVADVDMAAAQRVIAAAGCGRATHRYEDLLADPDVDAVVVAAPTALHPTMVEAAAGAGKHILCEKPIAFTLAEAERAVAAVEEAGVLLQLGFMLRFDAPFARAHEAIVRGEIGEPWIVRLTVRDPRLSPLSYLKTSGGQFKDQAIHAFDMACWLVGREVAEVFATGTVLVDPDVGEFGDVDTSLTTLRFDGGTLGSIDCSRQAVYGLDVRGEVHGSKGRLFIDYGGRDHAASIVELWADAYRDEMSDFVTCVRDGRTPRAGAADGVAALRIAVAAGRSCRERRAVRLDDVMSD